MKTIILLTIFIYSLSLTEAYYKACNENATDIISPTASICKRYSPVDGYFAL